MNELLRQYIHLEKYPRFMLRDMAIILLFTRISLVDFCSLLPINKSIVALGALAVAYVLLALSMLLENTKICWDGIFLLAATAVTFGVTYLFHPEYLGVMLDNPDWNIWSNVFNLCSMPFIYYFVRTQPDLERLELDMLVVAYVRMFGSAARLIQVSGADQEYNMTMGYTVSFSAIIFLYYYFKHPNKVYYLVFSGVGMLIALVKGSRGPILGYVCFIALYLIFVQRKLTKTKVLILAAGGCAALLYQSERAMLAIYMFLKNHGLESRTLEKIIIGEIADSSGRDKIYETIHDALLKQNPWVPYGAYGDRYITNGRFYSHNLIYEVLVTFGVVFGCVLLLLLAYYLIKACVLYRNHPAFGLLIALASYALAHLMFSTSFWYEQVFGAMLALMVTMLQQHKRSSLASKGGVLTVTMSQEDYETLKALGALTEETSTVETT